MECRIGRAAALALSSALGKALASITPAHASANALSAQVRAAVACLARKDTLFWDCTTNGCKPIQATDGSRRAQRFHILSNKLQALNMKKTPRRGENNELMKLCFGHLRDHRIKRVADQQIQKALYRCAQAFCLQDKDESAMLCLRGAIRN